MQLGRLAAWRHLVVAASIAGCVVLAAAGVIGAGDRSERFESKQITVVAGDGDALRVREVVDVDFGTQHRHGYERTIPNDFGVPTDLEVSSPDAPDDVSVIGVAGDETRIRIGDPDLTVSGQHRYVLEYTLPDARLSGGELALDVVGADRDQFDTERLEIVVTGLDLANPLCNVGAVGDSGGCALDRVDGTGDAAVYRTVVSPKPAADGITIGGAIVGRTPATLPDAPPLPARRPDHRLAMALAMLPAGLVGAGTVFWWSRRLGRNEVFAGGAAEAAYGALPAPGPDGSAAGAPVVLVADDRMDELATIEFEPPRGLQPWEGRVLLSERVDDGAVSAWFSGLVAREAITLEDDDGTLVLHAGPHRGDLDPATRAHVDHLFAGRDSVRLGAYDQRFSAVWRAVRAEQHARVHSSGWWLRLPPSAGPGGMGWLVAVFFALFFFGFGSFVGALLGAFSSVPGAIALGVALPAIAAYVVYRTLLASRSATGSALTLRAESFRRFLDASEGRHVEWAWSKGLVREYSAWAVALDEAEAWQRALRDAEVPEAVRLDTTPLLVYAMASSLHTAHTPPPSTGSGGGGFGGGFGGFSGGSVGGGGGGGGSGSW